MCYIIFGFIFQEEENEALIKKQGLVDTFYNKSAEEPVCGTFTSHEALNKVSKTYICVCLLFCIPLQI